MPNTEWRSIERINHADENDQARRRTSHAQGTATRAEMPRLTAPDEHPSSRLSWTCDPVLVQLARPIRPACAVQLPHDSGLRVHRRYDLPLPVVRARLRVLLGRAARAKRAALRKWRLFHVCGLVVVQDQLTKSNESIANYLTDDRLGIVAKLVGNCVRSVLKGRAFQPVLNSVHASHAKGRAFEPCAFQPSNMALCQCAIRTQCSTHTNHKMMMAL